MYKTIRHRARTLVASVAATTLIAVTLGTHAWAEDASIREMIFDVQSPYQAAIINVASSDGAKWDTIQAGQIGFWAHMKVDTRHPGWVERVGVFLGKCTNTACASNPRIFVTAAFTRDYDDTQNISFSTDKLKTASPSVFATPYGEDILRRCNLKLQPDGATKPHSFLIGIDASFTVNTRKDTRLPPSEVVDDRIDFNGGDATRHGAFLAEVHCLAAKKGPTADPKPDPHRTKVTATGIELFLATLAQPASTGRGPSGTQCKPIKVTTRIETDKAGPKNVRLWRQVNNGPITSEAKQMHATAQGGGKFGDDWVKWENFTKTTTVQYKAEVLGGTFEPSTGWKSITVHCNGNFASPTSDANPDNRNPGKGKPVAEPRVPTIVTPPPSVTCIGGKVAGGACACPRTHTLVKRSATASQCVKIAVVPDRPGSALRQPQPQRTPAFLVGPNRPSGPRASAAYGRSLTPVRPLMYFR